MLLSNYSKITGNNHILSVAESACDLLLECSSGFLFVWFVVGGG